MSNKPEIKVNYASCIFLTFVRLAKVIVCREKPKDQKDLIVKKTSVRGRVALFINLSTMRTIINNSGSFGTTGTAHQTIEWTRYTLVREAAERSTTALWLWEFLAGMFIFLMLRTKVLITLAVSHSKLFSFNKNRLFLIGN